MLKILGYNDVVVTDVEANHIELLSKNDHRTAWDFNRPIINVFNEVETTYQYLEALAKLELEDGVFPGSLTHEFNMSVGDLQLCRLNTISDGISYIDKTYAILRPGMASINGNIVVNKPNPRFFERQIAEVLGIFYQGEDEGVWIKYDPINHAFKCKIIKITNFTPTSYYYGCASDVDFYNSTIGISSLPLIVSIYNEPAFNSLIHAKFNGLIEKLKLETLYEISTNGTKYWNISNNGIITCDTTQIGFSIGSFINTSGIGSSIVNTHITHATTGTGSLVRKNTPTLTTPKINEDVALTATSTKLNLLASASGTTGTTSTNIVFSTSPTLTTPIINDIQSSGAADLWSENTSTNITIGSGLTTGTLTIGGISSTGTISMFPSTVSQAINLGTTTTGTITIGSTSSSAVQLPTGKTKIGQTNLIQGGAVNISLPTLAGTLIGSGDINLSSSLTGSSALTSLGILNGLTVTGTSTNIVSLTSGTTGTVTIDSGTTGSIEIGSNTGVKTINIGVNPTGIKTVNIGTGSVANVIGIGSSISTTTILGTFKVGISTLVVGSAFSYTLPTILGADSLVSLTSSGTLTNKTLTTPIINTNIVASVHDGASLGTASVGWSDIYLGTGGVITWGAASTPNVTIAHSAGTLTLAATTLSIGTTNLTMIGEIGVTGARVAKGWFTNLEVTNAPTYNGISIFTNMTHTTPIINDIQSSGAADLWSENTTTAITIGSGLTSGSLSMAGALTAGTVNIANGIGVLTASTESVNILSGAQTGAYTRTLNLGSNGSTGVVTNINWNIHNCSWHYNNRNQ
jgi:hypothetical protein